MIRELFTKIAEDYDRMNHLLSFGRDLVWRKQAAAYACEGAKVIIDLACGTGDMTFALAERFPRADITGLDFTTAMLDLARTKNNSLLVGFLEGDAQKLPDKLTNTVDLVTCAFGFRNIPNQSAVLAEAYRILRPGGELLVLEFFRAKNWSLAWVTTFWVKLMGWLWARDKLSAYEYLSSSMLKTVTVQTFIDKAKEVGFHLRGRQFYFPCCTCLSFVRPEIGNSELAT